MSDISNYLHGHSANTQLADHAGSDDRRASYEHLKQGHSDTSGYTELKHACLKCDQGVVETHQNDNGTTLISEVTDWSTGKNTAKESQNKFANENHESVRSTHENDDDDYANVYMELQETIFGDTDARPSSNFAGRLSKYDDYLVPINSSKQPVTKGQQNETNTLDKHVDAKIAPTQTEIPTNTEESQTKRSCKKRLLCFIVVGILVLVAATSVTLVFTVFNQVDCGDAPTDTNGIWTYTGTKHSDTAHITCNVGTELDTNSDAYLICSENGIWVGSVYCVLVRTVSVGSSCYSFTKGVTGQITCDIAVAGWGTTGIFAVSDDGQLNPIVMVTQSGGTFNNKTLLQHVTLSPSSLLATDNASLVVDFTPVLATDASKYMCEAVFGDFETAGQKYSYIDNFIIFVQGDPMLVIDNTALQNNTQAVIQCIFESDTDSLQSLQIQLWYEFASTFSDITDQPTPHESQTPCTMVYTVSATFIATGKYNRAYVECVATLKDTTQLTSVSETLTITIPDQVYFSSSQYSFEAGCNGIFQCIIFANNWRDIAIVMINNDASTGTHVSILNVYQRNEGIYNTTTVTYVTVTNRSIFLVNSANIEIEIYPVRPEYEGQYACMVDVAIPDNVDIADINSQKAAETQITVQALPTSFTIEAPSLLYENLNHTVACSVNASFGTFRTIYIQTKVFNDNQFENVTEGITTGATWSDCSNRITFTWSLSADTVENGTDVRCLFVNNLNATESTDSVTMYKTTSYVPANCTIETNAYYEHPWDCYRYLLCTAGRLYEKPCQDTSHCPKINVEDKTYGGCSSTKCNDCPTKK